MKGCDSGTSRLQATEAKVQQGRLLFPGTKDWGLRDFRHGLIEHSKFGVSTLYLEVQSPVWEKYTFSGKFQQDGVQEAKLQFEKSLWYKQKE